MINWQSLIFNSFWIFGAALLLAAFSYHHWLAGQNGHGLRTQLSEPGFLRPFWLAMAFVGVGLAGTSQESWEVVVWLAFTVIALALLINLYR